MKGIVFILTVAFFTFLYLISLNELTKMRLEIPKMEKKLRSLQDQNGSLQFEIEQRESPERLLQLLENPDFPSMIIPKENEVLFR